MTTKSLNALAVVAAILLSAAAWQTAGFVFGMILLLQSSRATCIPEPMMQGQDPMVALDSAGYLNLVQSDGCNIHLYRATNWTGLITAPDLTIYQVGCSNVWAPDLQFISNSWYLYYSVDTGSAGNKRVHVAKSSGINPVGPYTELGVLYTNNWNIDGSVFTSTNGNLYFICAAQPNEEIYIAPMSNPYTLSAQPTVISTPTKSWECVGSCINEGPWGFVHSNKVFIVYSASVCESNEYCLGLLTLTGANILNSSSWTKSGPVFTQQPGAYGPAGDWVGQDIAGQWWFMYHANDLSGQGCGGYRQLRVQRLYWETNNVPDFGTPVPIGSLLPDDTNFMAAEFPLTETNGTSASTIGCSDDGVLMGTPFWANPGLTLNGETDYVDCGPATGNDVQDNLTLAAWIRAGAFTDWAGIIVKGTNSSPYALQTWHDGTLRFTANWDSPAGGEGAGSWNSSTQMTTNQWYHVAVTYNGTTIRFYINAVLDSNQPAANLRFGVVDQSLIIGADFPVTNEYFNGTIRDVRVYGRALGAAEIRNISGFSTPPTFTGLGRNHSIMGVGQYLWATNFATEPEAPPQTLSYSLGTGPSNTQIDPVTGIVSWRPTVNQAPPPGKTFSVNPFAVVVADNGSPSLSATQTFSVLISNLSLPYLDSALFNSGAFQFRVSGSFGPDYVLQATTNLNPPVAWMPLITNPQPITPFLFNDPGASNFDSRFYRIQLGP